MRGSVGALLAGAGPGRCPAATCLHAVHLAAGSLDAGQESSLHKIRFTLRDVWTMTDGSPLGFEANSQFGWVMTEETGARTAVFRCHFGNCPLRTGISASNAVITKISFFSH
jgi:hypothetical protein